MNKFKYLIVILLLSGCSAIQVKNDDEWFIVSKELHPSGEVLCVPPYGTMDLEGSHGKVTLKKSNQFDLFIFRVVSEGLIPKKKYAVSLMQGEKPWESRGCDYGPWQRIGAFTTNEHGVGLFQIRISDSSISIIRGFISVWINDTETSGTILVSNSFKIISNMK